MQDLNFPKFQYQFKNTENNISIFDVIRKKYVILQPEEWVRQHCLHYLISEKNYPNFINRIINNETYGEEFIGVYCYGDIDEEDFYVRGYN